MGTFFVTIIAIIVVVVVATLLLKAAAGQQAHQTDTLPNKGLDEASPEYDFDIVGESFYQDALAKIAGPKTDDGVEIECKAILRPEPNNKHDKNAIAVLIRGMKVGYLSRTDAAAWRQALANRGRARGDTEVRALIVGGWKRNKRGQSDEGSFGVKLDL